MAGFCYSLKRCRNYDPFPLCVTDTGTMGVCCPNTEACRTH